MGMAKLYALFYIHGSFDIKVSRNSISNSLNKDEKYCVLWYLSWYASIKESDREDDFLTSKRGDIYDWL